MSKEKKANINIPKGNDSMRRNTAGQQYYSSNRNVGYPNGQVNNGQFTKQNPHNRNYGRQQNPMNQQNIGRQQNMNPQQYFAAKQKALSQNKNYGQRPIGQNPNNIAQNTSNSPRYPQANNVNARQAQGQNANMAPNNPGQYSANHARPQNPQRPYQHPNNVDGRQGLHNQMSSMPVNTPPGQQSRGAHQNQNSGFDTVVSPTAYQGQPYQDPTSAFAAHGNTQQNTDFNSQNNEYYEAPRSHVESSDSKGKPKSRPRQRSSVLRPIITLLIAVAVMFGLATVLREYVFQAYEIPSGSMEETIKTGDMVFAEKVSHYISTPKRGDIITFNDPEVDGRVLIKRCVATAGQTVDIKNNKLVVDGVELDEPYTNGKPTKYLNRSKISFPYTIPEGHIWVMGDNRTNSQDSRYYGAIPVSSVIGKALFVYWPTSDAKIL